MPSVSRAELTDTQVLNIFFRLTTSNHNCGRKIVMMSPTASPIAPKKNGRRQRLVAAIFLGVVNGGGFVLAGE